MLVATTFYATYTAVMSGQIRRIPKVHHTAIYTQLAGGAAACAIMLVPPILLALAAFRPERSPDLTLLLDDMVWFFGLMYWPPFIIQNLAFAFAILSDRRRVPLFPRWLGHVNIWAPLLATPATILPFFKSGPFAWGGIFVLGIPMAAFVVQTLLNTIWLLKAINNEASSRIGALPEGAAA